MHRRACQRRGSRRDRPGRRRRARPRSRDSGIGTGPSTTKNPYILPVGRTASHDQVACSRPATCRPATATRSPASPTASARARRQRRHRLRQPRARRSTQGAVRRHGQKGAFVSKLRIDRRTLRVKSGSDLDQPRRAVLGLRRRSRRARTPSRRRRRTRATPPTSSRRSPRRSTASARARSPTPASSTTAAAGAATAARSTSATRRPATRPGSSASPRTATPSSSRAWAFLVGEHARRRHAQRPDLVHGQEDADPGQLWVYAGKKTRQGDASGGPA